MADEAMAKAKGIREASAGGVAIEIALLHPDQAVLALAGRFEAEDFLNDEVLRH
jgi:hypothetical protein